MLGLAVALVVVLSTTSAHHRAAQPHGATVPRPAPPQVVSIPPPSGSAVVALPLAGSHTSAPAPADAVSAIKAGVEQITAKPVEPGRVELVAGSPDALSCLVDVGLPSGAPLLATARQVNGRWNFVGVQ